MENIQNENPIVYKISDNLLFNPRNIKFDEDDDVADKVTRYEIFEYIRHINDPEHPLTLEQLNVVNVNNIFVNDEKSTIKILFTPTIPHCSMATLIGLCIRIKLLRSLPCRFKITIQIFPGSHQSEAAINKQLNDKERVAAAVENAHLLDVVNKCIAKSDKYLEL